MYLRISRSISNVTAAATEAAAAEAASNQKFRIWSIVSDDDCITFSDLYGPHELFAVRLYSSIP